MRGPIIPPGPDAPLNERWVYSAREVREARWWGFWAGVLTSWFGLLCGWLLARGVGG